MCAGFSGGLWSVNSESRAPEMQCELGSMVPEFLPSDKRRIKSYLLPPRRRDWTPPSKARAAGALSTYRKCRVASLKSARSSGA